MSNKSLIWLDNETGEITPFTGTYMTPEQKEAIVKKTEKVERYKNGPSFVWVIFKYCDKLLPNISEANLTRLMYAATFCKNDGSLMKKDLLKTKLKLKKTAWCDFWNEMDSNNILTEKDDLVYINTSIFASGKIKVDENYTRLYCKCVQEFYEACNSPKLHKKMSYVFRIIPFISRRYNILCKNPEEQVKENIVPMTLGEFCDIIGYDRSQARRILKDMLQFRVRGKKVLGFFGVDLAEETWCIVANPDLYYGGNYDQALEQQKMLFESSSTTQN